MRTIPKIIHYCWFGTGVKPEDVLGFINQWKTRLPEYRFMEWNESNFDISGANQYVREAYNAKKYAFVSDFVRMDALHRYGGVYLDTDVELLKPFDQYLEDASMVLGFESRKSLLTAFIAVEKEHPVIREFRDSYEGRRFIMEGGEYDMTTVNACFSALMERHGVRLDKDEYQEVKGRVKVYPKEYFCGFDVNNWHTAITPRTCLVHHMSSSWVTGRQAVKRRAIAGLQKLIGIRWYDRLKSFLR